MSRARPVLAAVGGGQFLGIRTSPLGGRETLCSRRRALSPEQPCQAGHLLCAPQPAALPSSNCPMSYCWGDPKTTVTTLPLPYPSSLLVRYFRLWPPNMSLSLCLSSSHRIWYFF